MATQLKQNRQGNLRPIAVLLPQWATLVGMASGREWKQTPRKAVASRLALLSLGPACGRNPAAMLLGLAPLVQLCQRGNH
eukprot:CAMPEP_0172659156 /NCGR_PEP_ID=MMETSP1074-20121228/3235_1 /TAXON_ID=2916 /ORGANISM="Ceratium fusus, Strain PA161109" /LENGTH=79 /DNA_ID=CAMNT_0013474575 /DNA_START=231 /DNA_END=470 /DNA_ORIENTATION=-